MKTLLKYSSLNQVSQKAYEAINFKMLPDSHLEQGLSFVDINVLRNEIVIVKLKFTSTCKPELWPFGLSKFIAMIREN